MRRWLIGVVLVAVGLVLMGPTCGGPDGIEAEAGADDPGRTRSLEGDGRSDGREEATAEQAVPSELERSAGSSLELAPAEPRDPCSLCIEGRALTPEEQDLCSQCGEGTGNR